MFLKVKKELVEAAVNLIGQAIPCGNAQARQVLEAFANPQLCQKIEEAKTATAPKAEAKAVKGDIKKPRLVKEKKG